MPTARSNIALYAHRHKKHAEARNALIAEVHMALATLGDKDCTMIFCRKRDMAEKMAAVFDTDTYLAPGLNYAHVRYIFMLERPAALFDYQQQVKRSGRDNNCAESSLHTSEEDSWRIPSSTTDITLGVPELEELATNPDIC
ncbi:hypothetical protein B0H17DRAFT_1209281 [Mycena rosella]|uniref:Uncharacterized protein n=1 Tax=Mycena rosella TaxID=1033263 RepID=A0AAD7CYW3_MYCRO|nr:hypothetical protein B0H17DRAFT_1209281 [Mycena rosella]